MLLITRLLNLNCEKYSEYVSYLAKVNQKYKKPRKMRELFSTRLNKSKDDVEKMS